MIANRVSYFLGARGPSLSVDTGQSSGLVSVHLACESLRAGESSIALAGGVNLDVGPDSALELAALGALSPDGRCFTFDARANGFVRGEGGGLVVLKPFDAAEAGGDRILGVIRGSAVNNDGGGDGLTAPDPDAQQRLLRKAYENAGVRPDQVSYVELHGTGTPLGDRAEAAALGSVLGEGREGSSLRVGSAKTNIGHLEAAAGAAGLIKAVLALGRGEIPPSLNFEQPNPEIPLDDLGLRVQIAREPWPEVSPKIAGVSSFGLGGTNCHVVVEAAPEPAVAAEHLDTGQPTGASVPVPFVLSAKTVPALREGATRLIAHLSEHDELRAEDVGWSLATTRAALDQRGVVMRGGRRGAPGWTREPGRGQALASPRRGCGGQRRWRGAGVRLPRPGRPVAPDGARAARSLARVRRRDPRLRGRPRAAPRLGAGGGAPRQRGSPRARAGGGGPARRLRGDGLAGTAVALLRGRALRGGRPLPGEIAAAHVAGGLSLSDAALIVAARSRALATIEGKGGMLALALSPEQFEERARGLGGRVTLAAVNGPASVVCSGDPEALEELERSCEADGVRAGRIRVSYASHSPQVEAARERCSQPSPGSSHAPASSPSTPPSQASPPTQP